jgi:hypothetical protein
MSLMALALGWQLVSGVPAVKYQSQVRVETLVRAPLLSETATTDVIGDFLLAPRGEAILYTPRLEVAAIYEPQVMVRQAFIRPTLELLHSAYVKGTWKATRYLTPLAVGTVTYGSFPFETFEATSVGADGVVRMDRSRYIYAEGVVGAQTNLGLKRLNMALTGGWVVNGLLDPPRFPLRRGQTTPPRQVGPELRYLGIYSVTRRDTFNLSLVARGVNFSTRNRAELGFASMGLEHAFSPLVKGQLDVGGAATRRYPASALADVEPWQFHPTAELTLRTPVPIGHHWPVQARLRARYLPYVDAFSTRIYRRGEAGISFKWEGRKQAAFLGELKLIRSLETRGFLKYDAQAEGNAKLTWPLPFNRYTFLQAEGKVAWMRRQLISEYPIIQWTANLGLVIRPPRGRL